MEKFYIITEESNIYKKYFDYNQNIKDVNEIVKSVMENSGMETTNYSIGDGYFVIYPTQNDVIKFRSMLKKDADIDSTSEFKKSSKIYKEIFSKLDDVNLKVLGKPYVPFNSNIRISGKTSSRLFDYNGKLYCSIDAKEQNEFNNPDKFIEIKGSEFYKIMELF